MSRLDDAPELAEELAQPALRPFIGVHIDLPDPVHAVTGNATISYGGEEWTAVGGLASIDVISESADGSATGISATLSQIPSEFRDDVADQAVRGSLFEIFVGAVDATYRNVIGFKRIARATLQGYDISDQGETLTVKATGESRAINQRQPTIKRFTDEYQQRKHPGDVFFQYVSAMAEVPIMWAKAEQNSTSGGVGAAVGRAIGLR